MLDNINRVMGERAKMSLVLFRDAVDHLARIGRILNMQRGHMMFVGLGGSGKKSLV
jgi:dynein heavy chain